MAILHSNGLVVVDSIPTWTPTGTQATLARLNNTDTFYEWDGAAWQTRTFSTLANDGLEVSSGIVKLGDNAAGTSEPGVLTSDRFINQDGNDVVFVGETGAIPTEIIINDDGSIVFDAGGVTPGTYTMVVKPLQQDQGNTDFRFGIYTGTNAGSPRNNDVFTIGWNLTAGGGLHEAGKTAIGLSFENYYSPGAEQTPEFHLLYVDTAGVQYRPISFALPINNKNNWRCDFLHMPRVGFFAPIDGGEYASIGRNNDANGGASLYLKYSATQTGAAIDVDAVNNTMSLTNVGMTTPLLLMHTFLRTLHKNIEVQEGLSVGVATAERPLQVSKSVDAGTGAIVDNTNAGTAAYSEIQVRNGALADTSLRLMALGTGYTTNGAYTQNAGLVGVGPLMTGGLNVMSQGNAPIRFYVNGHGNERMRITEAGGIIMYNLPTYADEAAAVTGGLAQNSIYKTATGELRIKL